MGEWVRLTPPNTTGIPSYVKCLGEGAVYYLASGMNADDNIINAYPLGSSFGLTDAELNALSRHAPEVKALVEAARTCLRLIPYDPTLELPEYEALAYALAPFQEASGV